MNIEKGIELPSDHRTGAMAVARQMVEGDSILMERKKAHSFAVCLAKMGVKAVTRKVSDTHARVWHNGKAY